MIYLRLLPLAITALSALATLTVLVCVLALGTSSSAPSSLAALPGQVADIPPDMLTNYVRAAQRTHLDWALLAAIGKIESDHNRSTAQGVHSGLNFAGCCAGSMQISVVGDSRSTWARFRADGNNDQRLDIYDPADATLTAARYLAASGAPRDYHRAIYAYNHAEWYVQKVQDIAASYRQLTTTPPIGATPWQVLANPRVLLTPTQRSGIATGRIDPRIVTLLAWIAARHTVAVSSLRSDHSTYTTSGNVSNHSVGRAVDIAVIDGATCRGQRDAPCGRLAINLATLTGPAHITELIYCFDPDGPHSPDAFARADHCNHIHAGYDA